MPLSGGNREVHLPADRDPVEVFQQAISEHGFASEYVATTLKGNALFEEPSPERRRVLVRRFLSDHVVKHFAFEEQEVFPALRTGGSAAVRRLIDELIVEHEAMLVQVRALKKSLARLNSACGPRRWLRFEREFRDFLRTLLGHAMKEDNLFLALKREIASP